MGKESSELICTLHEPFFFFFLPPPTLRKAALICIHGNDRKLSGARRDPNWPEMRKPLSRHITSPEEEEKGLSSPDQTQRGLHYTVDKTPKTKYSRLDSKREQHTLKWRVPVGLLTPLQGIRLAMGEDAGCVCQLQIG